MGSHDIQPASSRRTYAQYLRAIREDLEALRILLEEGAFESDPVRVGAEQEYVLVDAGLNPAEVNEALVTRAQDERITTELGRFNLECNLSVQLLRGDCFSRLENELHELTSRAREAARGLGADLLLTGIPPHFEPQHLSLGSMTSCPRYDEINRVTLESFGGRIPLRLQGLDSFDAWHDNIMLEALATSFQVHLQVTPADFVSAYNCSVLLAAPLIAAGAYSPMLAGRRLWHETRVPLLESCADVRTAGQMRRGSRARTSLGGGWIRHSALEAFERELTHFRAALVPGSFSSSLQALGRGEIPSLQALSTFNGSVWSWMRPCYGVMGGRPHLRIENRILPSGPTLVDEVANAALWLGLMLAIPGVYGDIAHELSFDEAEANFHAAAREGLKAELHWLGGTRLSARTLLLTELIPRARAGLFAAKVDSADVDRLLGIVEERVGSGRTGAQWVMDAWDALPEGLERRERAWRIAESMREQGLSGIPVHLWPEIDSAVRHSSLPVVPTVSRALRTEISSVGPSDPIEWVEILLSGSEPGCVAVEDDLGHFIGLVTTESLRAAAVENPCVASELDLLAPPSLHPGQTAFEALQQMRESKASVAVLLDGPYLRGVILEEALVRLLESEAPAAGPKAGDLLPSFARGAAC